MNALTTIRGASQARRVLGRSRSLVIHAHGDWISAINEERHVFFTKLIRHATTHGVTTRVVDAAGSAARLLLDGDHINLIVGDSPAYGPNVLHALPSHVWGFWSLDELGTGWNSSIRFARFSPAGIDPGKAEYFFNGVTGYMLRENVSNNEQAPRVETPLPDAAAVVFCQPEDPAAPRAHYLTTAQMIRVTASARQGDPVYVKPHPRMDKAERKAILDLCADFQNVTVTDASVHDLTAASQVVVTQNSSAGFEALMQRRCVITCAKSDYWHATLTPKTESDLREALSWGAEAMADFPYERYLYWFLDRNCLEPAKDVFVKRAWARIKDKFFL